MANIYDGLNDLLNNMNRLFESVDISPIDIELREPKNGIILFFENLTSSGAANNNIREINNQILRTLSGMQKNSLDKWAHENGTETKVPDEEYIPVVSAKEDEAPLFNTVNPSLFNDNESLLTPPIMSDMTPVSVGETGDIPPIIDQLISMRDNLLIRKGMAELQEPDSASILVKIIDSVMSETALILKKNKVRILDETGKFNPKTQVVSSVIKTEDPALHNVISEVFRMGYLYDDKLIRPQEVVVYTCEG